MERIEVLNLVCGKLVIQAKEEIAALKNEVSDLRDTLNAAYRAGQ